ncbi:hypothetical protein JD77_01062 [Micromonospora olivasterospora]|uniref:Uncharacterized protein n=1 Tax=Micromonospora olivasterospora TaxID=1880 RepID=A0A562I583_MICOL|nr:hypothetical protein JD77_01062 [Micromonospora olivasterospora]
MLTCHLPLPPGTRGSRPRIVRRRDTRPPAAARVGAARGGGTRYGRRVVRVEALAAAYARWATPALPLYGDDHERADFAP